MGGGEGANERRRLKRLQAEAGGKTKTKGAATKHPSKDPRRTGKPQRKDALFKKKQFVKTPLIQKGKNSNPSPVKQKKDKVKKPKHLKRKLEQAVQSDDVESKKLKSELEDWERQKEQHSKMHNKNNSTNKRQSDVHEHSQGGIAPGFVRNGNGQEEDFDRSLSTKPSRPTISTKMDNTPMEIEKKAADVDSSSSSSKDESDDSSVEESQPLKGVPAEHKAEKTGATKEDANSDSDSSSDSDSDDEPVVKRERGKRRRGRKDTSMKIEEAKAESAGTGMNDSTTTGAADNDGDSDPHKKSARYCVGRKPVTDFVLGEAYPGKVVYIKPFGVFLDIGCHSDAFCHVSRLSDDYVESPDTLFREGDDVLNARVVEIDRKQKRITVSLQSEARVKDERASIEARKKRKELREAKSGKKKGDFKEQTVSETRKYVEEMHEQEKVHKEQHQVVHPPRAPDPPKDPSSMTPAELKRARKLERRAARREQAGEAETAPQ